MSRHQTRGARLPAGLLPTDAVGGFSTTLFSSTTINEHPARFVLLGASNLTYAFPALVEALRGVSDGPVEILSAHGHGRSYGVTSHVFHRSLPGIRRCGLWKQLEALPPVRICALVTDIGNDLLFGASPDTILKWVEDCLTRLSAHECDLILTRLPLSSVLRMSSVRYHATRLCFFPGRGPNWTDMQEMIHELDSGLEELGRTFGTQVVIPQRDWYGLDPIHIRRRCRSAAWSHMLGHWKNMAPVQVRRVPPKTAMTLWRIRPETRTLGRRVQETVQPCRQFEDSSRIFLY